MKTVLLVEDDPPVGMVLRAVLEDTGYRVILAQNGRDAFQKAIAERPDLIVTDQMMPIVDGVELIRTIRQDPGLRDVRIVLMSAVGRPRFDGLVYEGFLSKPFDLDQFLTVIAAQIGPPD